MPRILHAKKRTHSIDAQFALAERVLRGLNHSIDAQLERARDLEVEHAQALHKSGRASLHNANEIIKKARRRVG
jgi:hypothetical protein